MTRDVLRISNKLLKTLTTVWALIIINSMDQRFTPVAQYLRMSSDAQQLSLETQTVVIQEYAQSHGFQIVQSYSDPGKSGVMLKRREGLARLLHDVVSGNQSYKAILVYDVSRWGRFQDTDEAAHYEFVCRNAGIPIYYCAESFVNDGSPPNAIMKTLKRVMAGQYSRDLSLRVARAKRTVVERGFWPGGAAGYGLRRMLVDSEGRHKRLLEPGDTNSMVGGRVILVPGPAIEVATVRKLFRLTISGRSARSIAREFNRKQITCSGHPWRYWNIINILHNPKYMGCASCGRTAGALGAPRIKVQQSQWTIKAGAFEPIVDQATFEAARRATLNRTENLTNDELLDALRSLLSSKGRITNTFIDESRLVPSARAYRSRFGSITKACELIGYIRLGNADPAMLKGKAKNRRRIGRLRRELIQQIRRTFRGTVKVARSAPGRGRYILCFDDGIKIPLLLCRCVKTTIGKNRWVLATIPPEQGAISLICRCTTDNESILDFHLVPSNKTRHGIRLVRNDPWLRNGRRLLDLSKLHRLARSCSHPSCSLP